VKSIEFFVKGKPEPFARPSPGKYGGFYNPAKYDGWKNFVALVTKQQRALLGIEFAIKAPYKLTCTFFLEKPIKPKYLWPSSCDLDNLLKPIFDGLKQGGAIIEDRHIIHFECKKIFRSGQPEGVLINLTKAFL